MPTVSSRARGLRFAERGLEFGEELTVGPAEGRLSEPVAGYVPGIGKGVDHIIEADHEGAGPGPAEGLELVEHGPKPFRAGEADGEARNSRGTAGVGISGRAGLRFGIHSTPRRRASRISAWISCHSSFGYGSRQLVRWYRSSLGAWT